MYVVLRLNSRGVLNRYIQCLSYHAYPSKPVEVKNKRNIGIIAHIDAGKTTLTERMLFLTGASQTIGDVDDGNTITDFMDLERERGITIQSASVSSSWRDHQINLIDTPGHVDFTLEVERSLRVMDGSVTCIDASAGVQVSFLLTWLKHHPAATISFQHIVFGSNSDSMVSGEKFQLPSVFFVNKMDKIGANFNQSIQSIESRLSQPVVPIVVPILSNDRKLLGLIDVLNKSFLDMKHAEAGWTTFNDKFQYYEEFEAAWEMLISRLSDVNEEFENFVISTDGPIPTSKILSALRASTLDSTLSPLACGSALRSVASVKPVLDMIVDFLASPHDRHYDSFQNSVDFCALVYKIGHEERRGRLNYARIFKGQLATGTSPLNVNQGTREVNLKFFLPFGDLLHPVDKVSEGDIAVITGLKSTVTGDTLINRLGLYHFTIIVVSCDSSSAVKQVNSVETNQFVLEGISSPDPVFSCSIEAPSSSSTAKFEQALAELCIEDPSLRVREDHETGQTIIEGMGELHIEVIKERLRREYGLNVFMGPLRVVVSIDNSEDDSTSTVKPNWLKVINEGCQLALYNGPVLGFPVCNLSIALKALSTSGNRVNLALLSAAASRCVKEALKRAAMSLIEPIMSVEVTLVSDEQGQISSDAVLHELSQRRANIQKIEQDNYGHLFVIHASIPLSETPGISGSIRSVSSGMSSMHMKFADYQCVAEEEQQNILQKQQHRGL